MEYKNPKYNANGTIDVEINHPQLGWIAYTANSNDVEENGRVIFNDLKDEAVPYEDQKI